jgi:hypothetical protein
MRLATYHLARLEINMNALGRDLRIIAIFGTVSVLLILSASCATLAGTPSAAQLLVIASAQSAVPCDACIQATLAVALTQAQNSADNQAAATAEIVRANAQATLNSANSTLSAAQTQDQNNANVIAAQIAATAEIVRANAQATINSAGSTQSAALTQDAIRQTQMADLATTGAQSLLIQQYQDNLAASTQTAVANNIATQTQVAVSNSQWNIARAGQREEQRQGFTAFLWMLCFPIFILLLVGLFLWAFWRWLRIQQNNQRILENSVDRLQAPVVQVIEVQPDNSVPYIESDVLDNGYHTAPDNQMRRWLDEVKRKLRSSDKKDKDDNTDN